jgi:hypothetical protein
MLVQGISGSLEPELRCEPLDRISDRHAVLAGFVLIQNLLQLLMGEWWKRTKAALAGLVGSVG